MCPTTPTGQTSPNACVSRLDPEVSPPGTPTIGVTTAADAFGQPHLGKQITLSNTKVTVSVPASILQLGVDAGLVFEGQQIPSVLRFVIAGVGTTQKTKITLEILNQWVTWMVAAGVDHGCLFDGWGTSV